MNVRALKRIAIIWLVFVPGCAVHAQAERNGVEEAAVRAARTAQNLALAEHNIAKAASYWTADIVVTAGLGTVIQGSEAYRNAFALDENVVYQRVPDQIAVSNNPDWPLAFESGRWTGRARTDGSLLLSGRYSAQWVKEGAHWRIRSELFVALDCAASACEWSISNP